MDYLNTGIAFGVLITPVIAGLLLWARGLEKKMVEQRERIVILEQRHDNTTQNLEEIKIDLHEIRENMTEFRKEMRQEIKDLTKNIAEISQCVSALTAKLTG